jgi:hypothetical protein
MECKGLIFRCKINSFTNVVGHYVYSYRMIPLKRKSCGNECMECSLTLENFYEDINNKIPPTINGGIFDNALYELEATNFWRNPETGYIEDWEMQFTLYKEEENGQD